MKKTSVWHYLAGAVVVLAGWLLHPVAGVGLGLSFVVFELWDRQEWATSQHDYWEFVVGMFVTAVIVMGVILMN